METPRWNWRLLQPPARSSSSSTSPSSSRSRSPHRDALQSPSDLPKIWVGATANPPSSHPFNTLSGTVLLQVQPANIRVRLLQEVAVRRDTTRRRARSLPVQSSSYTPQWAATLSLGTGIHRGGVVADATILSVQAEHRPNHPRYTCCHWAFQAHLPDDLPRAWTWAACEGDRKKIWYLDLRYRIVAEAYDVNGNIIATAKNFVDYTPKQISIAERPYSSFNACHSPLNLTPRRLEHSSFPDRSQHEDAESVISSLRASTDSKGNTEVPFGYSFEDRRRTAMAFDRKPKSSDTLKRRAQGRSSSSTLGVTIARSMGTLSQSGRSTEPPPIHAPARRDHSFSDAASSVTGSRWSFASGSCHNADADMQSMAVTEDFEDMSLTTYIHTAASSDNGSKPQPQLAIGGKCTATIIITPKTGLTNVKITGVFVENVLITDECGNRQVDMQHHHGMRLSKVANHVPRGVPVQAMVEIDTAGSVLSADAEMDFTKVRHRVCVSVTYEKKRLWGGVRFGDVGLPCEHDLWDVVSKSGQREDGLKEVRVRAPLILRKTGLDGNDRQCKVPVLPVWGSTGGVDGVGKSEARGARRRPSWALQVSARDGSCCTENDSKIDALRELAYAKGGARRRANSPDGKEEQRLQRFPTFEADGELAERNCPVCLESLSEGMVMMLPCMHAGHRVCLVRSQNRRLMCPVCRLDLSPFVSGDGEGASVDQVVEETEGFGSEVAT